MQVQVGSTLRFPAETLPSEVQSMSRIWLLLLLLPSVASPASLYLCKSYGGGTFWSQNYCGQHSAVVERIVNVPDNLPFDQQVQLGEQARAEGRRLATSPQPTRTTQSPESSGTQGECAALDAQIRNLDAMARRPQSGPSQDRITAERKDARDRQFRIKCK